MNRIVINRVIRGPRGGKITVGSWTDDREGERMPWRWAKDAWWSGDKLGHFLGGLVSLLLLWAAFHMHSSWDAWVRWEDVGWLGGDGFSWRDGLASTAGVWFGWIILELFGSCLPGA
ncbi:MAG: hypothetical protein NTW26_06990 [bacterium]|nr:hypothetical protein [bacterium]